MEFMLLLGALGLGLMCGCSSTPKVVEGSGAKFVPLDKGVERSVTCPSIQERFTDDGRLELIANLRNRLNRRIEVQVSCVFKDDKGFPTNDEAPFKTLILDENAQEGVRFVSMNNQARTYTIRVRQAR